MLLAQTTPVGQQATTGAQPPAVNGIIVGRVIDGTSGTPLTGVTVTLSTPGQRAQRVIVDGQGRYLFHSLPAGAYTLATTKAGYLAGTYGQLRPDGVGRTLDLDAGERVLDSAIRMWRSATISGSVIDDAGDPVPARVQVYQRTIVAGRWKLVSASLGGDTDARGQYRITGLKPGDYALVITSFSSSAPASLLHLVDALRRAPGPESTAIQTELSVNGAGGVASDLSQRFEVSRVGDLLLQGGVLLSADGQHVEHYPTVWYPSASTPDEAAIVTLSAGENRAGIDLRQTLTRGRRIAGTVTGPAGPVAHLNLRLVPARLEMAGAEISGSLAGSLATGQTISDANGAFTFIAVPPGQYVIRAMTLPRPPAEPPLPPVPGSNAAAPAVVPIDPVLWAGHPVTVGDADAAGVAVTLRQGLRVTGRTDFEGTAARPPLDQLRRLRWTFEQADGRLIGYSSQLQAQIDPSGRFYSSGLIAGHYLLRCDVAPAGWTIKSALLDGRDVCDQPLALDHNDRDGLVITFTDRPTMLEGLVRNAQGQPDADATVLVFPAAGPWTDLGGQPRRMRSLRVSRTGSYALRGLPAGEYCVIAVSDSVAANWQEPAFLNRIQTLARRITLPSGGSLSVPLTTATGISR